MNIGEIKLKALNIAERKKKNSSKEAVLFFYEEIKKSYIKKSILIRTRECSKQWQERYLKTKKYISSVKRRLSILGFDVKKIFLEEEKK